MNQRLSGPKLIAMVWVALVAAIGPAAGRAAVADDWREIDRLVGVYSQSEGAKDSARQDVVTILKFRLEAFVASYPADKNTWTARALLPAVRVQVAQAQEREVDWDAALQDIDALLSDPALPKKQRPDAERAWLSLMQMRGSQIGLNDKEWTELTDRMEKFAADYPREAATPSIQLALGHMLRTKDPARAKRALQFAQAKGDEETAAKANRELAVLPYRTAPLELHFKAVDGRKVDVADLRGKIVLVDFWATWCGPCVRELPEVLAAYRTYHDRGLEIVGISLDESRSDMTEFTKRRGMVWPQYCDSLGWDNKISRRFGITSIPTMWLLDRDGKVISTDVRNEGLAQSLARVFKN